MSEDERARHADQRDETADNRDRLAGHRDRVAGTRDRMADAREEAAEDNGNGPAYAFRMLNRQTPFERLAAQSAWVLICALALLAAVEFWREPVSRLDPPPLTVFGGFPVLSALWNTLLGAFGVLVLTGLAANWRRWETVGQVCLIVGACMQAISVLLFGQVGGGEWQTVGIDMLAAASGWARVWALRRPLRAVLEPEVDG